MSVSTWSTDPNLNINQLGLSLADGVTRIRDLNDQFRVLMSQVKIKFDAVDLAVAGLPDSDLTAIAALATTPFGRNFLTLADAATSRTYIGAQTALGFTPLNAASNLSDLANAATSRTSLGLGTAATSNLGTSGANVPLLNGANTWSAVQTFAAPGQNVVTGTSHAAPATSGTAQTGSGLRVTHGNTSLALDFGGSNTGGTWAWLQSTDRNSLGTNYELRFNPNGGAVRVGGSFAPLGDGTMDCGGAINRFDLPPISWTRFTRSGARPRQVRYSRGWSGAGADYRSLR